MNIDKDIEILKNPSKIELTKMIREFKREGIDNFITVRKENLDNVLSGIDNLKQELETYKKIAEWLADEILFTHEIVRANDTKLGKNRAFFVDNIEQVIDWARKEVEKDD